MDKPTPLINSSMLSAHRGQTVRLVGKVQKVTGNTLLLQCSDLGNVEVALTPDSDVGAATHVEVTGKVAENGADGDQVREFTTVDIGDTVGKLRPPPRKYTHADPVADMSLVEQVIQISGAFPALFTENT